MEILRCVSIPWTNRDKLRKILSSKMHEQAKFVNIKEKYNWDEKRNNLKLALHKGKKKVFRT